jgi:hypothetical protein
VFYSALFATEYFRHPPSPLAEIKRFRGYDPAFSNRLKAIREFVQSHTVDDKKVTLFYDWGDLTGIELNLTNVMAFPNPHSILLKEQLKMLKNEIESKDVRKFFAVQWFRNQEVDEMLNALGFKLEASKDLTPAFSVLEFWSR